MLEGSDRPVSVIQSSLFHTLYIKRWSLQDVIVSYRFHKTIRCTKVYMDNFYSMQNNNTTKCNLVLNNSIHFVYARSWFHNSWPVLVADPRGGVFFGPPPPRNRPLLKTSAPRSPYPGNPGSATVDIFSHPFDSDDYCLCYWLPKRGQSPSVCLFPEQLTPTPRNNRQFTKCDKRLKRDDQNTKRVSSQYWSWSQSNKKRTCIIHCYVLECVTYQAKNLCCAIHSL